MDEALVSLLFLTCLSYAHLCEFPLLAYENSRIFQRDTEPQVTLEDHVFKIKFALHSELSVSANSGSVYTNAISFVAPTVYTTPTETIGETGSI